MAIEQLAKIVGDIHPFLTAVHLREKQKTARELYTMVEILLNNKVPLSKIIVNDRVDVAVASEVLGVQLAYHSLETKLVKKFFPNLTVGTSIHSVEEGEIAIHQGTDYVMYGHIFSSRSKLGKEPRGLMQLQEITKLQVPVIAVGGITPENTKSVIDAGTSGIAVISGILYAKDPVETTKSYIKQLKGEI